jgi:hypothetical protein
MAYIEQYDLDVDTLEIKQTSNYPIYYIADNSFFIYPSVKEVITD